MKLLYYMMGFTQGAWLMNLVHGWLRNKRLRVKGGGSHGE